MLHLAVVAWGHEVAARERPARDGVHHDRSSAGVRHVGAFAVAANLVASQPLAELLDAHGVVGGGVDDTEVV